MAGRERTVDESVFKPVRRALLLVVAGPSGCGKSTLCDRLLAERPGMRYSISCTTRPPRGQEVDGRDYHFLDEAEFRRRREAGEFLESAEVHGHLYGTLRGAVVEALSEGRDVVMDIDVQGAHQIRIQASQGGRDDLVRRGYVDVFLAPPSLAVLEQRVVKRGEDSPEAIARRMRNAIDELSAGRVFQYRIVNDRLETAYTQLAAIVEAEHCRAQE